MTKSRGRKTLIALGVSAAFLVNLLARFALAADDAEKKFSYHVDIVVSGEKSIQDTFLSYARRELRTIPDISVDKIRPQFCIKVLASKFDNDIFMSYVISEIGSPYSNEELLAYGQCFCAQDKLQGCARKITTYFDSQIIESRRNFAAMMSESHERLEKNKQKILNELRERGGDVDAFLENEKRNDEWVKKSVENSMKNMSDKPVNVTSCGD